MATAPPQAQPTASTPATGDPRRAEPGAQRRTFFIMLAATVAVTTYLVIRTLVYTDGHISYAIDDAGIHLSMARQLAEHGTWGVSEGVYEPASSSPAWTVMLAAVDLVVPGRIEWVPLLANLALAALVLWIVAGHQRALDPCRRRPGTIVLAIVLPVFGFFLPGLAFTGMEHTAHAAIVLALLVGLVVIVTDGSTARTRVGWFALVALGSFVRFETAFVAAGAGVALLVVAPRIAPERWPWARRLRWFTGTAVAAAVPILLVGFVNLAFDRSFLPNSLLRKTVLREAGSSFFSLAGAWDRITSDSLLGVLLIVAVVAAVFGWRQRDPDTAYAVAFLTAAVVHLLVADVGWWGRYQAYLVIAGLLLALRVGPELIPVNRRETAMVIAAVLVVVLSFNRVDLTMRSALGASNTYRQQNQVGRFLAEYYDGEPVMVVDLGYTSYRHDGPIYDLEGLGTYEVLQARADDRFDREFLRDLAARNDVEAIVIYALPYLRLTPPDWQLAGDWDHGQVNVSPLYRTVSFYAPDAQRLPELEANLADFAGELPDGVEFRDRAQIIEETFGPQPDQSGG